MKILSLSNNNHTAFYSRKGEYITKKFLEPGIRNKATKNKDLSKNTAVIVAGVAKSLVDLNKKLKSYGISYCSSEDNYINICSGKNHGFYKIKTPFAYSPECAKGFVLVALSSKNPETGGGIANYIEMVKDLKRQDIIQKGLRIHTYEINNRISSADSENAAAKLSKCLKKSIKPNDLFFIEEDAFYYDSLEKTAYGVDFTSEVTGFNKESVLVCKFITNKESNAIGYNSCGWDSYKQGRLSTHYTEQQVPDVKLKSIAEPENNKEYAEAFRFGNSPVNYHVKEGVPKALEHIRTRVGVIDAAEDDLQIVRFYDKDKNVKTRICYYDSSRGNSFVYSTDGTYMYQLEYSKDHKGDITALNRL